MSLLLLLLSLFLLLLLLILFLLLFPCLLYPLISLTLFVLLSQLKCLGPNNLSRTVLLLLRLRFLNLTFEQLFI